MPKPPPPLVLPLSLSASLMAIYFLNLAREEARTQSGEEASYPNLAASQKQNRVRTQKSRLHACLFPVLGPASPEHKVARDSPSVMDPFLLTAH